MIKKYHGKDGKIDMCKGLYDWIEEERMEGKREGVAVWSFLRGSAGVRKRQTGKDGVTLSNIIQFNK